MASFTGGGFERVIPPKDDDPAERFPLVTVALVAANAIAFGWQLLGVGLEQSVLRAGAIPYEILTFQDINERNLVAPPLTILSSMFLHGGVGHIASNMLMLWIFGNHVEDVLGRARYLLFYVLCGIVAALAQTIAAAASGDVQVPMVGASGAIAGVLAAYLVLFPHARVLTRPAGLFIGVWFVLQIVSVIFGGSPGVAFFAHIGGFVAGYLLVRIVGRRATGRARRVSW